MRSFLALKPQSQTHRRAAAYVALFVALVLGYPIWSAIPHEGSAQVETLMEAVSTVLAFIVGILALVRFYSKKNNTFLFIGTAFLGTAALDCYHAAVSSTFFSDSFPSAPSSLDPWSWFASRIFLSLALFLSWWAWEREERMGDPGRISERGVYLAAGALTLASFLFFAFVPLPRAYYPQMLFLSRPGEFVPALLFLLALVGYLHKGHWKQDAFEHWLVLSLIVGFVGHAVFMSSSTRMFDMAFDAAHLLKSVSYVLVLIGLLVSMYELFKQAEEGAEKLAKANEELQGSNAALRESEERARLIVETAYDAFISMDASGVMTAWNAEAEATFGWSRSEAVGLKLSHTIIPPQHREAHERALEHLLATGEGPVLNKRIEITALHRDGHEFPIALAVWPVRSGESITFNAFMHDITESKAAEKNLRIHIKELAYVNETLADALDDLAQSKAELQEKSALLEHALGTERERARRDPLTGALNHAAIVDELRDLISHDGDGASHAVAMIDVDGLKAINDTYGHQVGDAVLVTVAGALSLDGALVGRYGGDEFVALLPGADRGTAERYRQEVLSALGDTTLRDPETGARVPVAVSVGLAIHPTEAGRLEELIKAADSAMYAWRRQRPVGTAGKAPRRPLGGDRAAKMVGEIVPLLTSPGDLNDKLRLVSHRLSVGAGYDAVNVDLFARGTGPPTARNVFAKVPDEVVETWRAERRSREDDPFVQIVVRTRRPVIVEEPQNDPRLTETQRSVLRAAELKSAIVVPLFWRGDLVGTLSVASKRKVVLGPRDAEFLVAVASQVTAIVRMATLVEELQTASDSLTEARAETVMLLAAAAEAHDQTTGLHLENVWVITDALARELGFSEEDARELGLAAVLHDIGKIRVPDVVLSTAGQLSDEEWKLLRKHTVWGEEFLRARRGFDLAATIARSHHEHWDGSGYPDGLSGKAIPEAATIVAVTDAFDAMTSHRPYRPGRSVAAAVRELVACSGKQFNTKVVQALVALHDRKMLPRPVGESPDQKTAA